MSKKHLLEGLHVKRVRKMTVGELEAEGWEADRGLPKVVEFEDGTLMYASQDDEGNGPGTLFGRIPSGEQVYI